MPGAGTWGSCWWTPRHSSPPSSPLETKADVPPCSASLTALFTAATSVGEKMASH